MQYIVLDTCIILHILRGNAAGAAVNTWIDSLPEPPVILISTVTKAELESLKIQRNWGGRRLAALNAFLDEVTCVDIGHTDKQLLDAYARIDSYSKGKAPDINGAMLPGSARIMGKNDLWIAATAHVLGSVLVTADGDFGHLDGSFLVVKKF